jgi:ATP-dependent protease ClpP protease subunit
MKISKLLISLLLFCKFAVAAPREVILTEKNTVVLAETINPFMLASTLSSLFAAQVAAKANEKVYLLIYTNGGMVDACERFTEAIDKLNKVEVVILRARSAGALVSQCSKLHRSIDIAGDLVFHKIRLGIEGFLTAKELKELSDRAQEYSAHFDNVCRVRLKISKEDYDEKTDGKDWFISPKEAVEVGAADEVVEVKCSPEYEKKSPLVPKTDAPGPAVYEPLCQIIKNLHAPKGKSNGQKTI